MDLFCDDDSDGSNDSSNEDEMKRDLNPSYRQMMLSKRPQNCGVMAFHSGTEESLFLYVQRNAQQGDPLSVLKAIDVFCYSRHWMMHTGDRKVKFLDKALQTSKKLKHGTSIAVKINDCSIIDNRIKSTDGSISDGTKIRTTDGLICLEIGSYCGYSAVKIAATFEENVGSFLYCIENDSKCVHFTERMLGYAGLSDKVKVILGNVDNDNLIKGNELRNMILEKHGQDYLDILFIDHDKQMYLNDLNVIEEAGLLRTNSVVVADNVLSFNSPLELYLQHVRDNSERGKYVHNFHILTYGNIVMTLYNHNIGLYSHSELHRCYLEYSNGQDYDKDVCDGSEEELALLDGLEISIFR